MLGLVGGLVGYVDHNLTPLFWALIILIALDLLMNLNDEAITIQKLFKGILALFLPVVLKLVGSHVTDPLIYVQAGIAVALGVEISTVGPLLVSRIADFFPKTERAGVTAELDSLRNELAKALETNKKLQSAMNGQETSTSPASPTSSTSPASSTSTGGSMHDGTNTGS
jgi:hypothetical protein